MAYSEHVTFAHKLRMDDVMMEEKRPSSHLMAFKYSTRMCAAVLLLSLCFSYHTQAKHKVIRILFKIKDIVFRHQMELVFRFRYPDIPAGPCARPTCAIGQMKKYPAPPQTYISGSMVDWKDIFRFLWTLLLCKAIMFLNGSFHSKFIQL